jgi:hypothetical protein
MRIGQQRGSIKFCQLFAFVVLTAGLGLSVAACSKSDQTETKEQPNVTFDASKLPRVSGAKEVYANPATTIFTSPEPVAQTADTLGKALAAVGWQSYAAPHAAQTTDPNIKLMTFKRDAQAFSAFITVAPAQNNATNVQYAAVEIKNDLPFPKDASAIEYDPNRPLLLLVTGEPVDKTLDFYRKGLETAGWSLWSQKLNEIQPAGGASGEITKSGAYAYYVQGNRRLAVLQLQRAEAGPTKVKFEELPVSMLASMQREFFNSDNTGAAQVDVSTLPRLEGAMVNSARSSGDRLIYLAPGSLPATVAATEKLLAADGWKKYEGPLEEHHETLAAFKKGRQGLSVSYSMVPRQPGNSSVDYSPARLRFALAIPDDATDVLFDENRPYLNFVTAGTTDATLGFFRKELAASGWSPLVATDAVSKWPNAKLDEQPANGTVAYFIRGTQRPIVLTLLRRDDGKTSAEIKVPPFAEVQTIAADGDVFGLPKPKPAKSAGGTRSDTEHTLHATVPAEVDIVLAFYRGELAALNWKEEAGAVVNAQNAVLNFTAPEGPAVLTLGHKYDLTTVSLVLHIPKPAVKPAPALNAATALDDTMKQMQQMMRDAGAAGIQAQPAPAQAPRTAEAPIKALADDKTPVPVPDSAHDVEFDGNEGRLEFSADSSVAAIAEFYRSTMKDRDWSSRSSVVNNANIVVLNFAKADKSVSITALRMGPKTKVTAHGEGLQVATAPAAKAPVQASADDLVAEESGGLPLPKRHTMSVGSRTQFRRELKASVPLELTDVLGFYRRELGKLNWNEETKGTTIGAESVVIAYTTTQGPGTLKLSRKDDATDVELVTRDPGAASKGGVLPKAGQGRVLISNLTEQEAAITLNNKTLKVAAGAGTKNPDGPILDLPPGKYQYSIKLQGRAIKPDVLEVGADETWGLVIGPGGGLPLQAY